MAEWAGSMAHIYGLIITEDEISKNLWLAIWNYWARSVVEANGRWRKWSQVCDVWRCLVEIISTVVNDYDCCILGKDNLEDDVLDDGDNDDEDNYDQGDFEVLHFLLQTFTWRKMFVKYLHRDTCLTNIYIGDPMSVSTQDILWRIFWCHHHHHKNYPVGGLQRKDLKQIDLENWQPEACRLTIQPWGGWRRRGWMQRRDCLRNTIWLGILGLKGKAWHLSKLFKTCIKSTQGNNVNVFWIWNQFIIQQA